MSVSLLPQISHKTAAQDAFDEARLSHQRAMDAADAAEVTQYNEILRALQIYGQVLKPALSATHPVEGDQRTTFATMVGVRSAEKWTLRKAQTAAIVQGLADSMGVTRSALCDELAALELPGEFETARATITGA